MIRTLSLSLSLSSWLRSSRGLRSLQHNAEESAIGVREKGRGEKKSKREGKNKKKGPYAARQDTLNSTFAIMRVGGYVNVRGTLITHTRCTIPRGCSRKSSLFFRQGNNEWTPGDFTLSLARSFPLFSSFARTIKTRNTETRWKSVTM